MRILFDHNVPVPLRYSLTEHEVATTADQGWDRLTNGKLLSAAEEAGFDMLLTADKGFQHQHNLTNRRIRIVVLRRGNWPDVKKVIPLIVDAVGRLYRAPAHWSNSTRRPVWAVATFGSSRGPDETIAYGH